MDQGLVGGPRQETYDVIVDDVGQLVALPGEASDVPMNGFLGLLLIVFEILGVPRTCVHALEVLHEDLF